MSETDDGEKLSVGNLSGISERIFFDEENKQKGPTEEGYSAQLTQLHLLGHL